MLKDYFAWWAKQMGQWVPPGFAGATAQGHALIILAKAGGTLTAILRRQRRDQAMGDFTPDEAGARALAGVIPERARPPAIVLRLPADLLLEREVVLPLVADHEIDRILTYEMDRFTPFGSGHVFWTYVIQQRDRARDKLHLRLSMVTKGAIEPLLALLTQAGLAPTALEISRNEAAPCRIALHRPDTRALRRDRMVATAAAGGCVALALAAAALPFVMQSIRIDRIEAQIVALQPGVTEAEALQRRLTAATAGVDVFVAEQTRIGDALTILADLTGKLPDDTYLTDLSLRQGKLLINGVSAAAVRLIAALSGDDVLRNPEFVAPVNRIDGGRADMFAIRAEVAH